MRTRLLSGGTWVCGKTIVPEGLTGPQLSFNFTVRLNVIGGAKMLGQMKRQLENSRCFRQGMEKDLEECAEARWLAKPVLDSRALPLDSDNVRLQGPVVMSFEKSIPFPAKAA